MLGVLEFLKDKGGDPEAIRESQRKRGNPVEAVDEVIALYNGRNTRKRPIYLTAPTKVAQWSSR